MKDTRYLARATTSACERMRAAHRNNTTAQHKIIRKSQHHSTPQQHQRVRAPASRATHTPTHTNSITTQRQRQPTPTAKATPTTPRCPPQSTGHTVTQHRVLIAGRGNTGSITHSILFCKRVMVEHFQVKIEHVSSTTHLGRFT